jgi:hypothetical protein
MRRILTVSLLVLGVGAAAWWGLRDRSSRIRVVTGDGMPVAGAAVEAWVDRGEDRLPEIVAAETDADGLAVLPPIRTDKPCLLFVHPPAEHPYEYHVYSDRLWRPADTAVALRPRRGVAGTVVDPDGRPVPGVRVLVAVNRRVFPGDHRSDDEGRFRVLDIPEGRIEVTAVPPDWRDPVAGETVRVDGDPRRVRIPFRPSHALRVLVPGPFASHGEVHVRLRVTSPPGIERTPSGNMGSGTAGRSGSSACGRASPTGWRRNREAASKPTPRSFRPAPPCTSCPGGTASRSGEGSICGVASIRHGCPQGARTAGGRRGRHAVRRDLSSSAAWRTGNG